MVATILSIVAIVVSIVAIVVTLATRKLIHRDIINQVGNALNAWTKQFEQKTAEGIGGYLKGAVTGAVSAAVADANIPKIVEEEVSKHQTGALLIEG